MPVGSIATILGSLGKDMLTGICLLQRARGVGYNTGERRTGVGVGMGVGIKCDLQRGPAAAPAQAVSRAPLQSAGFSCGPGRPQSRRDSCVPESSATVWAARDSEGKSRGMLSIYDLAELFPHCWLLEEPSGSHCGCSSASRTCQELPGPSQHRGCCVGAGSEDLRVAGGPEHWCGCPGLLQGRKGWGGERGYHLRAPAICEGRAWP